jgi:PAS domain S-box-containing protein
VVGRDITESRLAAEALRESEEKYRTIIENLMDTYYRTDAEGRLILISPSGVRNMGYHNEAEMLGRPVREFFADPADHEAVIREIRARHSVSNQEVRLKRADGTIITALYSSNVYTGADGVVLGSEGILRDITDYRKAEEALRESEQIYHSLFDNAVIGIFRYSPVDNRLDINPAFAKIFGYDTPEALIRDHPEIPAMMHVRPEDRQMVYDMLAATGRITNVESEQWHKDGHTIWIVINAQAVRNDAGEVFLVEGTIEDSTARRLAADELQAAHEQITASEEELRSQLEELVRTQDVLKKQREQLTEVAEMVPGVVYQFYARDDGAMGMYYLSRRAGELFGFPDNTPDFFPWFTAHVDERDRPGFLSSIDDAVRAAAPWNFEGRFVKPSGEQIWFHGMSRPVRHGNELVFNGILLDVTGRRMAEERLRESEERFRHFASASVYGMGFAEPDGHVLFGNAALLRLVEEVHEEDFLHNTIFHYYTPQNAKRLDEEILPVVLKTGQWVGEIPLLSARGRTVLTEQNIFLIRDSQGTPRLIGNILTDITERKGEENALRDANKKVSLLSSITRHDILNKVSLQLGLLELARQTVTYNAEMASCIGKLESAAKAIRDQIEFTKIYQDLGSHTPLWQDLHLTLVKTPVPPELAVSDHCAGIEILADGMLENVFANLIDNAIRHGGNVTTISMTAEEADGGLVVRFRDNGAGIPYDEKEMIFERGYGKNTGLGLFLAREILSITGITIHETGEQGQGAQFEMVVPPEAWRYRR